MSWPIYFTRILTSRFLELPKQNRTHGARCGLSSLSQAPDLPLRVCSREWQANWWMAARSPSARGGKPASTPAPFHLWWGGNGQPFDFAAGLSTEGGALQSSS